MILIWTILFIGMLPFIFGCFVLILTAVNKLTDILLWPIAKIGAAWCGFFNKIIKQQRGK